MKDVQAILDRMTLEDKIALCSGKNFWETKAFERYGVPALVMCDGPHGLRHREAESDVLGSNDSLPATCFPTAVSTAASWDPALLAQIGAAIGEEAKAQGVGMVLGPGVNMKRNPLCGRNFEYFSEDPVLAGKLAAGFIRGLEEQGVGSSLKHFAANSQEHCRFNSDGVMDERTLRELYLPAFEIAVREGEPATVMCAYPKLNGVHCSDNRTLLTDILRREWGYEGLVVSDWAAMNDRVAGFRAGCDLSMPGGSAYMEKDTLRAVRSGALPETAVDESAARVLRLAFRAQETLKTPASCDYEAHHALAKRAACAGAVLLKNEGGVLPLREGTRVAAIGHMARSLRYQGAGSSHINPTRLSHPLDFLPGAAYAAGCDARGETSDALIAEAVEAARAAEAAVVFVGLPDDYECEGVDRKSMEMPEGQLRVLDAVAAANPNTVAVLLCGAPVECPWAERVRAILYLGLPGQAGGEAAADLLYGRAEPAGRLAETWPLRYADCVSASYYGKTKDALYLEGLYTGYRYYDKAEKTVRWPFGYGLSYTRFACSDLRVDGETVAVTVTNCGDRPGAEVVQLYVEAPQDGLHRPLRTLRGFQKVYLEVGERQTVSFSLTDRDFAVWRDGWVVPAGDYTVCVGPNSRERPLRQTVHRDGAALPVPEWQAGSFYERCQGTPGLALLEAAMGRAYVPAKTGKGAFTMDDTLPEIKEAARGIVPRLIKRGVERTIARSCGGRVDHDDPDFRTLMNSSADLPLRAIQIFHARRDALFPALLEIANGHILRGIGKMLRG